MKRNPLGRTGETLSALMLGTMTFGTQTSEADAGRQMDRCLDAGVDCLDTAEMYPTTPMSAETVGRTEEIVGSWVAASGRRDDMFIATKVTGEGNKMVRGGAPIDSGTIRAALEGSLRRLRTDRVDLYQLHWANRGSYMFRKNWNYAPDGGGRAGVVEHMEDVLSEMGRQIEAGKIRHWGLSNETAWGTTLWCLKADEMNLPRPVAIQNEYSLMCRLFDTDLAEVSAYEDVGLLAFSPLAAGYLTGKYADGAVPANSRKSIRDDMGGRESPRVHEAAAAHVAIARDHDVHPVHLALAWAMERPFMTSVIFGATTADQLEVALGAIDFALTDGMRADIAAAHKSHPMPY